MSHTWLGCTTCDFVVIANRACRLPEERHPYAIKRHSMPTERYRELGVSTDEAEAHPDAGYAWSVASERASERASAHLSHRHCIRQVLLVGEYQHHRLPQFVLRKHAVQLVVRLSDPILVVRINHKNLHKRASRAHEVRLGRHTCRAAGDPWSHQALGVLVVVAPQRADLRVTGHDGSVNEPRKCQHVRQVSPCPGPQHPTQ
jgi:hypothetical protein